MTKKANRVSFPSGHTLVVSHDLDNVEMVSTLATIARAQRIDGELATRLSKSEAPSPEPELFMRSIVDKLHDAYIEATMVLVGNMDRWFKAQVGLSLFKAMERPPLYLTQAQIDELAALVRANFQAVVRFGAGPRLASGEYERRWREMGLIAPSVQVGEFIRDAFHAGRLHDILTNNSTFSQMRFAARGLVPTRAMTLMLETVQRDAALWLLQPVNRLIEEIEMSVQAQNNEVVRGIVGQYMSGALRHTAPNPGGLTPEEVAATSQPSFVQGWRELGKELRNRMSSLEVGRDWDRVAATESRFAYNMGRLTSFRERGYTVIEWQVQPNACPWCKELLLNPDGTRRQFSMEFMEDVLRRTNGTNFGRRASRIGRDGGWLPTAIIHPWCRCTPFPIDVLP